MTLALTVTAQVAFLLPSAVVTVIVALPAALAVTTPEAETVATSVLLDDQVTSLFVAFSGVTVAVSVAVSPSVRVNEVLSRLTPVTETVFALTVTTQSAVLPPSSVVTRMVASPAATAVTVPFSSTVATAVFKDFHVTVFTDAVEGERTANNSFVSPSVIASVAGLTETDSTATYFPSFPCWLTLILADPDPELMVMIPSRSYPLFSVTEKLTPHWKIPAEELMDWTLTHSGLLFTDHFVPLWTVTERDAAPDENDNSVTSTLSVSGASAS